MQHQDDLYNQFRNGEISFYTYNKKMQEYDRMDYVEKAEVMNYD